MSPQALNNLIMRLIDEGKLPITMWPSDVSAEHFGLSEASGYYRWRSPVALLDPAAIDSALNLEALKIFHVVGSTNTELMATAAKGVVNRFLYSAECQIQGRGRRGRAWTSPFARNLAFSYGHVTPVPLNKLGGLSLVVGLAVAESINSRSSVDASLKWPNDLVVGEQKLGGILVELMPSGNSTQIIVGVGVNVSLQEADRADVERQITDLHSIGNNHSRTEELIEIVSTLQQFLARFDEQGFEPFVEAFNAAHIYHGKTCAIHQGDQIIIGEVDGVAPDGALILYTDSGLRSFHGGEVSLRPN